MRALLSGPLAAELERSGAPNHSQWEAVLYFTVTYDGVPVGAAELEGWGIRAGRLFVLPSYFAFGLARPARRLGIAFLAAHWVRVPGAVASRAWYAASAAMEAIEERLGLTRCEWRAGTRPPSLAR